MDKPRTITLKSTKGRFRAIYTDCAISPPFIPKNNEGHPEMSKFLGLWDTGAQGTVISANVAKKIGLIPMSMTRVHHANGEAVVNVYLVNVVLPNSVGFSNLKVTEGILDGFDVLIGMDIITLGDFAITNVNNNTTFSFRIPSLNEIDFAKEDNSSTMIPQKDQPINKPKSTDRNLPCHCGSGKKLKRCCGRNKY